MIAKANIVKRENDWVEDQVNTVLANIAEVKATEMERKQAFEERKMKEAQEMKEKLLKKDDAPVPGKRALPFLDSWMSYN